jgi:hypothetical protein
LTFTGPLRFQPGRPTNHPEIAKWCAQTFPLHVDLCLLAVNVDHDTFETETADGDPRAGLDRSLWF